MTRDADAADAADAADQGLTGPALVAPGLDDSASGPSDPDSGPTPAQLADSRLGDVATPTETFGSRRLDLRTDESTVPAPADTPAPMTALGLASVRREAGASLFADGHDAPAHDAGWDSWAGNHEDTDHRMAQLDDELGRRRTRIGRAAARIRRGRDDDGPVAGA